MTWRGLRMQTRAAGGRRRAPAQPLPGRLRRAARLGRADYVGLFAVTAGLGVDKKEAQFVADHDDYSAIMLKALADRLAEALCRAAAPARAHRAVGLRAGRALEQRGADRREVPRHPARAGLPGLPGPPRQARDVPRARTRAEIGMGLTESLAMTPAASVSGFYLAHPQSTYFNVGKIGEDQLADWARAQRRSASKTRRAGCADSCPEAPAVCRRQGRRAAATAACNSRSYRAPARRCAQRWRRWRP